MCPVEPNVDKLYAHQYRQPAEQRPKDGQRGHLLDWFNEGYCYCYYFTRPAGGSLLIGLFACFASSMFSIVSRYIQFR